MTTRGEINETWLDEHLINVPNVTPRRDTEPALRITGHRVSDYGRVGSGHGSKILIRLHLWHRMYQTSPRPSQVDRYLSSKQPWLSLLLEGSQTMDNTVCRIFTAVHALVNVRPLTHDVTRLDITGWPLRHIRRLTQRIYRMKPTANASLVVKYLPYNALASLRDHHGDQTRT